MKTNYLLFLLCFFASTLSSQIVINEYSASNLSDFKDVFDRYEDWIELYNSSNEAINLEGYYLSDKINNPTKFKIPAGISIEANGFLVVYTSGRGGNFFNELHTSFKLSQTKDTPEYVVFADKEGTIIDSHEMETTQLSHSRGRIADGSDIWGIYVEPSIGESNNTVQSWDRYADEPIPSKLAGSYTGFQEVSFEESEFDIRYTLDGSLPTEESTLYTEPLVLNQTKVLKARAFRTDVLPSKVSYNTYLIDKTHTLPILSVASEELYDLLYGDKSFFPIGSAEYFDAEGVRTTHSYGDFNSHGQDSWVHDQRSIDFICRDEMGYSKVLKEKLLPTTDRDEFQRLILRASGDDNYPGNNGSAHIRDIYVQTLAEHADMELDTRKGTRIVMYVNGNYWGIYSIREKVDDPDYTKYYYDQGKFDLEFIMLWGWTWVEFFDRDSVGVYQNWAEFQNFVLSEDMSLAENYNVVDSIMDVQSLVDYALINSHVVCSDWLNWNVGWWRGINPEGKHKKWGYILWDEDATFGHYINYTGIPSQTPDLEPCFHEGLADGGSGIWGSDPENHMEMLVTLRENEVFEQAYLSRYIDLMNTHFSCDYMVPLLDSMAQVIRPEIPEHAAKWGGSIGGWENNLNQLRNFIIERCNIVPDGLSDCYNLTGPYDLTLDIRPYGVGHIDLNTIEVKQFPWTGQYYGGIDIKLDADKDEDGWYFSHWESSEGIVLVDSLLEEIAIRIDGPETITAVYTDIPPSSTVEIDEVQVTVRPNPFTDQTTLILGENKGVAYVDLFDQTGKKVSRVAVNKMVSQIEISDDRLRPGLYFYQLVGQKGESLSKGKIICIE